jgi:hypothetical protein
VKGGKPLTTFVYEVQLVLAFVLATSNSIFNLSITLRWLRLRCCCCCPQGCCCCCWHWVPFPFPA